MGLYNGGQTGTVEFITIASQGNATRFGDLSVAGMTSAGLSNSVRGIMPGRQNADGNGVNTIDFNIIANGGTSVDFGDLNFVMGGKGAACSNGHGGLNEGYQGTRNTNLPYGNIVRFGGIGVGDLAMFNNAAALETLQISTLGNAVNFGTLSASGNGAGMSSNTRAVYHFGSVNNSTIEYVEFQSKGNGADFGDVTVNRQNLGGVASHVRGVLLGGEEPAASDTMDYITIATIGDATDFGNLTVARGNTAGLGNNTRGVCVGGYASPAYSNVMDYITIASAGNATDFGNLLATKALAMDGTGGSSTTRGIIYGGYAGSAGNVIEYITFANTGNSTDFGDATGNIQSGGASGNGVRGLYAGGTGGSNVKRIDYITIATTGNAADFGDLTTENQSINGTSNCHGGLQA